MFKLSILLFLGGIGQVELIAGLIIFAIAGFFLWRILLKYLLKKGQTGINTAAFIMGSVQSPFLFLVIFAIIYWIATSEETREYGKSYDPTDSIAAITEVPDTAAINVIDVVNVSPDKCKVLLENEYVRIIRYSLKPGESDNPHTHPPKSYYVVAGGTLRVFPEGGEPFDAEEVPGAAEWSGYVGKHYVKNVGKSTVTLVLTEVKAAQYY